MFNKLSHYYSALSYLPNNESVGEINLPSEISISDFIDELNKKSPLEIQSGALSSGRHRACAMIGRILRGESYVPLYAKVLPKLNN